MQVPGDLISDLQAAKVIGDPLFDVNFKATTWDPVWTYTKVFDVTDTVQAAGGIICVCVFVYDSCSKLGETEKKSRITRAIHGSRSL